MTGSMRTTRKHDGCSQSRKCICNISFYCDGLSLQETSIPHNQSQESKLSSVTWHSLSSRALVICLPPAASVKEKAHTRSLSRPVSEWNRSKEKIISKISSRETAPVSPKLERRRSLPREPFTRLTMYTKRNCAAS